MPAPYPPERVERHHHRHVERPFHRQGDEPRHPEVRVYDIVRETFIRREVDREACEVIHERQQRFLANSGGRTSGRVHDADARRPSLHFGKVSAVASREHIDGDAATREMQRKLGDVNVLATTVHAAGYGGWRRVLTDECNAPDHWSYVTA